MTEPTKELREKWHDEATAAYEQWKNTAAGKWSRSSYLVAYKRAREEAFKEYSERERQLIELANAHLKDLYEYAGDHEVMSHIHGWRIPEAVKQKFKEHRDKWAALSEPKDETPKP